jgi:hypothetical protein
MNSTVNYSESIFFRDKFPNIPYAVVLFAVLFGAFYLMNPGTSLFLILVGSASVALFILAIEAWGLRFRLRRTENRLLLRNVSGEVVKNALVIRRRNIILSSYSRLCTVLLIGLIVACFHLGVYSQLSFSKKLLVLIVAVSIPDIISSYIFRLVKLQIPDNKIE